jgi:hypothetical protein
MQKIRSLFGFFCLYEFYIPVMFANCYIEKNIVYPRLIDSAINSDVKLIVMVPCLNEPEIIRTLESLWICSSVDLACEVIVLVNDSESSPEVVKAFNRETYIQLKNWKLTHDRRDMTLHPVYVPSVDKRHSGAGMARKIGMDEAVRRLNDLSRADGIIVSLDADCVVSPNYLKQIERAFASLSCFGATINFKHRVDELLDDRLRSGIELYEKYLHYYKKALAFTGFPHSIYTIGSAFAVRADAYVKQGGMNRRQAGEDFYFLNKLTQLGKLTEINDAFVYPSARVSNRVPFGTGASMTKWMKGENDLTLTYNFNAFCDLKKLFDEVDSLYHISDIEFEKLKIHLPDSLREYMQFVGFDKKLDEIKHNCSTMQAFKKRFFQFFDAFVVMRFLNISHPGFYKRQNLEQACEQLEKQLSAK